MATAEANRLAGDGPHAGAVRTWLAVAAEAREFDGILQRAREVRELDIPQAAFAREIRWDDAAVARRGETWILVANGPGARQVEGMLGGTAVRDRGFGGVLSAGFCGALDPSLEVGDIVVSGEPPREAEQPCSAGEVVTLDRVVITSEDKRRLYQSTGALAVEMEAAAVAARAHQWGLPFRAVRVVTDTAAETLPLDFNQYRDEDGRFNRGRIARAALLHPVTAIPGLLRLNRNCRLASEQLGEFLAGCRF